MVKAKEVHDGGVEVVHVDLVLRDGQTDFVGAAVGHAAFDAAARHPDREAVGMVIAADLWRERKLRRGRATHFTTPNDEGVFEHPALFEVREESANGLIALAGEAFVPRLQVRVAVPRLTGSVIDLDVSNAAFGEATRDEDLTSLNVVAIHLPRGFGFLRDIEGIGSFRLHAKGEFQGLDPGFELRIGWPLLDVEVVELLDVGELAALLVGQEKLVLQIGDEILGIRLLRVHVSALVDAGEKGAAPVGTLGRGHAIGAHDDEPWEALVFGPKSIERPRTNAGTRKGDVATVHHHEALLMIWNVAVHRPDDAEVVRVLGHFGKELADLQATLAVFGEFEGRGKGGTAKSAIFGKPLHRRDGFAVEFLKQRLGIEGVDLRGPSIHEKMNDSLGLCREVRLPGSEWREVATASGRREGARFRQAHIREDTTQGETTHAEARLREDLAASEREAFSTRGMAVAGGVHVSL